MLLESLRQQFLSRWDRLYLNLFFCRMLSFDILSFFFLNGCKIRGHSYLLFLDSFLSAFLCGVHLFFSVTSCLTVAVRPCVGWIPLKIVNTYSSTCSTVNSLKCSADNQYSSWWVIIPLYEYMLKGNSKNNRTACNDTSCSFNQSCSWPMVFFRKFARAETHSVDINHVLATLFGL